MSGGFWGCCGGGECRDGGGGVRRLLWGGGGVEGVFGPGDRVRGVLGVQAGGWVCRLVGGDLSGLQELFQVGGDLLLGWCARCFPWGWVPSAGWGRPAGAVCCGVVLRGGGGGGTGFGVAGGVCAGGWLVVRGRWGWWGPVGALRARGVGYVVGCGTPPPSPLSPSLVVRPRPRPRLLPVVRPLRPRPRLRSSSLALPP